jgi:hypothetical protein
MSGTTVKKIRPSSAITPMTIQAIEWYCQWRSTAASADPPPMNTTNSTAGRISTFQCGCLWSTTFSPRESRLSG